ncbi:hypothetical protein C8R44DRAFT_781613 [Mycena epipterygia]|nr:hypothetical protein C8R44DRAFT_781613 [Mycena epipterygia]
MGTQTEACEAPAPAVNTEVALGPSEEHRRAMAGIGALFGQPRLKGSKVHRRVRGLQGAEASTSDDLLAELKKHFSTPPCLETVDTSPADNETPSPPSPRTVLRARPRVHREKNDVPEKSELELLFERRKSRDQQFDVALDTPLLAVGQHDPSPAKACLRRPLSEIHPQNLTIRSDAGPCVTTNTTTTTASPDLAITPFGMRKLRRVVVPPLLEGAQASRDPRILLELDSLRSRGKVGGDGQTEGMPEREMSLAVQGILRKNRKENQKSS